MTFQVIEAAVYTTESGAAVAHELTWSDGKESCKVRAVVKAGGWIHCEGFVKGKWVASGKPYIVKSDKKRQGDRMIKRVAEFLA
jgi:hypothetical protein